MDLAVKNQIILTSVNIPQEKTKEYDVKVLSRGQLLTQYLVEIIRGNSKFYITFAESIENVEKLMEIPIPDSELWKTQKKMLYLNVVIAMETYLSDAFTNTVVNNKNLIRKLLKTSSELKKRKFKVSELINWLDDMKQSAEEHLLNIVYHNIWKVKNMYKDVLDVDFPDDLEDIQRSVMRRHDIVHRNGKTKDGIEIKIDKEDIKIVIERVKDFIKYIDDQLSV